MRRSPPRSATCSPRSPPPDRPTGVAGAFAGRRFPLRAYGGAWAGQLRWGRLTHARVLGVLKKPFYAGAYVHGMYSSRRNVVPDGTDSTALAGRTCTERPMLD